MEEKSTALFVKIQTALRALDPMNQELQDMAERIVLDLAAWDCFSRLHSPEERAKQLEEIVREAGLFAQMNAPGEQE